MAAVRSHAGDAHGHHAGWWLWRVNALALLLWPLSLLFCGLVLIRRALYQRGWLASRRLPRPLVVVGNLSVGGSGKTPLVVEIARLLRHRGYHPGILCRGYKSDLEHSGLVVEAGEQNPAAGDEANLLAALGLCPVGVGADRHGAGQRLLEAHPELDLLISDDGLQHYALQRDLEFLVIRKSALGNGWCLPAGPLREPLNRKNSCDLVIERDANDLRETLGECWNLAGPDHRRALDTFRGETVYAIAGIGFPQAFFAALEAAGLQVVGTAFPDHHAFVAGDLEGFNDHPLLVTHKDAVKLQAFATDNVWVVPLELRLSDDLQYRIMQLLESKIHG